MRLSPSLFACLAMVVALGGCAPLVQQADYWLQGDMLELVPALTQALAAQIVAAK